MSSDFFAGPATQDDIRAAFRFILRREPDEAGFAHYLARAERDRVTIGAVIAEMYGSTEFAVRHDAGRKDVIAVETSRFTVFVDRRESDFGRHIAAHRSWEPHIVEVIARVLQPGDVFVDIGANVGIMSFEAAYRVGQSGRVIAFEPNHDNAQNFLRGVKANGFERYVKLFPFALSAREDIFSLEGGSNTHLAAANGRRVVQAVVGDDLLADQTRIDFIKIDIEGHEPHALAGLRRTIARHRPTVLCEFNPRCLRDHIGKALAEFARELFTLTSRIEVIEHDGHVETVHGPSDLLGLWQARNATAVSTGFLPDGMLHFDLLFRCR